MEEKRCFAFKNKDERIRRLSTSGGAFSALAEHIINNNGIVYGAAFDQSDMSVQHIRVDSKEQIGLLRGSKYLQSKVGDSYVLAKKDLEEGKIVLFSGTPCQVDGLRQFVGKKQTKLYTCDIICHGVSSPMVWKEFIKYKESTVGKRIQGACFRDKEDYSWSNCQEVLYFEMDGNGTAFKCPADEYAKIFYDHEAMRPSCYKCRYTNLNRPGDVTLGDFWGIDKTHPAIYDELGVSFIMQNTAKGQDLIDILSLSGCLEKAQINETRQPQLRKPVRKPATRKWFWSVFERQGIEEVIRQNSRKNSLINMRRRIISSVKTVVREGIKIIKRSGV